MSLPRGSPLFSHNPHFCVGGKFASLSSHSLPVTPFQKLCSSLIALIYNLATASVVLESPFHRGPFSIHDCWLLPFRCADPVELIKTWASSKLPPVSRRETCSGSFCTLNESCLIDPEMQGAAEMAQAQKKRRGRFGLPVDSLSS